MKIRIIKMLLVCLVVIMSTTTSFAQLGGATKVSFDYEKELSLKVPKSVVWSLIKDISKWSNLSGGYILSSEAKGEMPRMFRFVTFADSTKRTDKVLTYNEEWCQISCSAIKPIPGGISDNCYIIQVMPESSNSCKLFLSIRIEGNEKSKKELLSQLKKELEAIENGVKAKIDATK